MAGIAGGAGAPFAQCVGDLVPHVEVCAELYHFVQVDVDGATLKLQAIDETGLLVDTLTLEK